MHTSVRLRGHGFMVYGSWLNRRYSIGALGCVVGSPNRPACGTDVAVVGPFHVAQ